MNKAIAVFTVSVSCALLCLPAAAIDLKKYLPKSMTESLPSKAQDAQQKLEQTTPAAVQTAGCAAPAAAVAEEGKLSFAEKAKVMTLKLTLDAVLRDLKLEDVQLPDSIDNVCVAEKRLAYVQRATGNWSVKVIEAVQQAKQALDIDNEVESYRAFTGDPDFGKTSEKDIDRLRKDMKNDLKQIEQAIVDKKAVNEEKLAEAGANMRSAVLHGGLIGAWDKRLVEFLGDNSRWALDNLQSVSLFKEHVGLLGSTLQSIAKVTEARSAGGVEGPAPEKLAAVMKQREKENEAFEKQLAKDLDL